MSFRAITYIKYTAAPTRYKGRKEKKKMEKMEDKKKLKRYILLTILILQKKRKLPLPSIKFQNQIMAPSLILS